MNACQACARTLKLVLDPGLTRTKISWHQLCAWIFRDLLHPTHLCPAHHLFRVPSHDSQEEQHLATEYGCPEEAAELLLVPTDAAFPAPSAEWTQVSICACHEGHLYLHSLLMGEAAY